MLRTNQRDATGNTILQSYDKALRAITAHYTAGLSPIALASAYADWALHLATAPGKQMALIENAVSKGVRLSTYMAACNAAQDTEAP